MKEINMQSFDGTQPEIPRAEQNAAAEVFRSGIHDLLEQHRRFVDIHPLPGEHQRFQLDLEYGERPDPPMNFIVRYDSQGDEGKVEVDEPLKKTAFIPDIHTYTAGRGTVHRTDMAAEAIDLGEIFKAFGSDAHLLRGTNGLFDEARLAHDKIQANLDRNQATEQELGLNNQPVGVSEVMSLFDVIRKARPKQITGDRLLAMINRKIDDPFSIETEYADTAARMFNTEVTRALDGLGDDVSEDASGRKLVESEFSHGVTWKVTVAQEHDDNGGTMPYVRMSWKQTDPHGVAEERTVLEYSVKEGSLVEALTTEKKVVFAPGITVTKASKTEVPGDAGTSAKLRNFLLDRKTTYSRFLDDPE